MTCSTDSRCSAESVASTRVDEEGYHLDPLTAAPKLPVKDSSAHVRALQRPAPPATDFTWSDKGEIHAIRRRQILAQHPEIHELYGPDVLAAVFAFCTVLLQYLAAYLLRDSTFWVGFFRGLFLSYFSAHCPSSLHYRGHL